MTSIADADITTDRVESNSKTKCAASRPGTDQTNYGVGWNVVRTLGEGAYGEVKLVVDSQNPNNAVAMKVIDLAKHPDVVEAVRKEALLMRMLRDHVNIIKYLDMRFDENLDEFRIFLEYADGGELFDQIEPDVGMPTQKAQFYFRQLMKGIDYIHSRGVAHRDIKPENLLLTKNDMLKISDFGMATVFRHNGRERMLDTRCGTLPYVAPEVLSQKYKAQPADVWSCGVVLVALLAGELAWDSPTSDCDAFNDWTESANLDANPWNKIGTVALSLLRAILNNNPLHRASIKRIQAHPWFTKDFSKERAQLSRVNSNGLPNDGGSGTLERPAKRRKRSLHTVLEVLDGDQSISQPIPGNNSVLSSDCGSDAGCPEAYKRPRDGSTTPPNFASTSFSQPENVESMLLSYSQIGCSQSQSTPNPLQRLVRRMTRFCVTVPGLRVLPMIVTACDNLGYTVRMCPRGQLILTVLIAKTRRETSFVVSVYEMGGRVLVDCRRSKGDGLEFKRAFVAVKQKLDDVVCRESSAWLEVNGLVSSQFQFSQLSLARD